MTPDEPDVARQPRRRRRLLLVGLGTVLCAALIGVLVVRHEYHDPPTAAAHGSRVGVWVFLLTGADADGNGPGEHYPALHEAARRGHAAVGKVLLLWGAAVDNPASGREGRLPLHCAAREGQGEFVRLLLRAGADANARDLQERCALHLAAEKGHVDAVRALLADGADPNLRDDGKRMPLHGAAEEKHAVVCEMLLAEGADPECADVHGWTPLKLAETGPETVAALLEGGADANHATSDGWSLLTSTLEAGNTEVARTAIEHGADPCLKGRLDRVPLYWAVQGNYHEIVKLLVEKGALRCETASFAHAVYPWCRSTLKPILEECPPELLRGEEGSAAVFLAAEEGFTETLKALLQHGADPNATSASGKTALHRAAELNMVGSASLLLAHGADPNAADQQGRTPLACAFARDNNEIVRMLVAFGADVRIRVRGASLLYHAARRGDADLAALLLSHGAEVDALSENGDSPLHEAVTRASRRFFFPAVPIRICQTPRAERLSTWLAAGIPNSCLYLRAETTSCSDFKC